MTEKTDGEILNQPEYRDYIMFKRKCVLDLMNIAREAERKKHEEEIEELEETINKMYLDV